MCLLRRLGQRDARQPRGTTANGTGALANALYGVAISLPEWLGQLVGDDTAAGSNTIAFNGDDGITSGRLGNEFSRNSVFSNAGMGIDLEPAAFTTDGPTPNDGRPATTQVTDSDTGSNGLQNKPVISSAKTSSTKTTITGKLDTVPNTLYRVEFFSNPSGNEGKKFVGVKLVSTDASGNAPSPSPRRARSRRGRR